VIVCPNSPLTNPPLDPQPCVVPDRSRSIPDDRKQTPNAEGSTTGPSRRALDSRVPKNPAAVELGRLGGLKGGKARAASLSPERKTEIARKAAAARWAKREAHD
jgi:hypothetical protein